MLRRYSLSSQFIVGLEKLAASTSNADGQKQPLNLHQINLTAILFATTYLEAYINELIAVFEIDKRTKLNSSIWAVISIERKITLVDKFNLLCALLDEEHWDSSKEPFQSFEILQFIRNEIVHHKGKYDLGGKAPKRIKNLLQVLDCKVDKQNTWLGKLLDNKKFSKWILEVTMDMDKIVNERILKYL